MEGQETALGEATSMYGQDGKGGYLRAVLVKHVGGEKQRTWHGVERGGGGFGEVGCGRSWTEERAIEMGDVDE